jgi:hypothetical protein
MIAIVNQRESQESYKRVAHEKNPQTLQFAGFFCFGGWTSTEKRLESTVEYRFLLYGINIYPIIYPTEDI